MTLIRKTLSFGNFLFFIGVVTELSKYYHY